MVIHKAQISFSQHPKHPLQDLPPEILAALALGAETEVRTRVNWSKLQLHRPRIKIIKKRLQMTACSFNVSKENSKMSAAIPMYTRRSCESWSRVSDPLGRSHLPRRRRARRNCSKAKLQESSVRATGMFICNCSHNNTQIIIREVYTPCCVKVSYTLL